MTYAVMELVCKVCEPNARLSDTSGLWRHLVEHGHIGIDLSRWPDGQVATFDPIGDAPEGPTQGAIFLGRRRAG